jgi:hypothetical protein
VGFWLCLSGNVQAGSEADFGRPKVGEVEPYPLSARDAVEAFVCEEPDWTLGLNTQILMLTCDAWLCYCVVASVSRSMPATSNFEMQHRARQSGHPVLLYFVSTLSGP